MKFAAADFSALPSFDRESDRLNVIIETAKGSRNKYAFEPELGCFKLKKVLPLGAVFPFDFGFIPSTKGEDGDPLDILVLMDEPAFCGCIVPARLLGVIEARQREKGKTERNDRLIAVADKDHDQGHLRSLKQLNPEVLREIEHFFTSYNALAGKQFTVLRRSGPAEARKLIQDHSNARRSRK